MDYIIYKSNKIIFNYTFHSTNRYTISLKLKRYTYRSNLITHCNSPIVNKCQLYNNRHDDNNYLEQKKLQTKNTTSKIN